MRRERWFAVAALGAAVGLGVLAGAAVRGEPGAAAHASAIDAVAPLAGLWRAEEEDGAVFEEVWMPPEHGQMTGALRWFGPDGGVRLLELLTIREVDDGLEYSVRHFDAGLTPWASEADGPLVTRAERLDDGPLVFNTVRGSDSLAGATIDLGTPDRFRATLTFTDESGRAPIILEFERVRP